MKTESLPLCRLFHQREKNISVERNVITCTGDLHAMLCGKLDIVARFLLHVLQKTVLRLRAVNDRCFCHLYILPLYKSFIAKRHIIPCRIRLHLQKYDICGRALPERRNKEMKY